MFWIIWDPFGPVWTLLNNFKQKLVFAQKHLRQTQLYPYEATNWFLSEKVQKCPDGPKRGPKLSKTSRLTITDPLDPFGPLWNVDKPAMFGHFCLFYWCIFWGYPVYICAPLPFLRCYLHIRWYFFTWSDPLSQIFCLMNKKDLFCSAKNPIWHFWLSSILSTFQQLILNNISKTKS